MKDKIKGEGRASMTHYSVGTKVRRTIEEIDGEMPEELPPKRHIKNIEGKKTKKLN